MEEKRAGETFETFLQSLERRSLPTAGEEDLVRLVAAVRTAGERMPVEELSRIVGMDDVAFQRALQQLVKDELIALEGPPEAEVAILTSKGSRFLAHSA